MISKNKEGKLVVKRGSKVAFKVRKDEGAAEVRKAAVKKHSDHDQFFSMQRIIIFYNTQIRRW